MKRGADDCRAHRDLLNSGKKVLHHWQYDPPGRRSVLVTLTAIPGIIMESFVLLSVILSPSIVKHYDLSLVLPELGYHPRIVRTV